MTNALRRLTLTSGLFLSTTALFAQDNHVLYTLDGDAPNDLFGIAVDGIGDVDGDGRPDLVIGSFAHASSRGMARVISGATGTVIFTFYGDDAGDRFGCSVAAAGDVNRDGIGDILVGAYLDDDRGIDSGSARVFSGRDGKVLRTFYGAAAGDHFGYAVSSAGDVNRDRYADILVGAYLNDDAGTDAGCAYIFSGKNGRRVRRIRGSSAHDWFGYAVHSAGDINGDRRGDVIIGACYDDTAAPNAGAAQIHSGKNGRLLHKLVGLGMSDWFGASVAGVGDVDGDRVPDVIVGAHGADAGSYNCGSATVFSGRTGSVIFSFAGKLAGDELGVSVRGCGDIDGDGRRDLLVGAYRGSTANPGGGSVYVFSGANGKAIKSFEADSATDRLGIAVAGVGDVNGDGLDDFVAGAVYDDGNGSNSGSARIFSGAQLSLLTDHPTIQGDSGGSQVLTLDAGLDHAGHRYVILGSATGTQKGIPLGGLLLPLDYDVYTAATINSTNSAMLTGFSGQLDADGRATASFNLPADVYGLLGRTYYHAYVVIAPDGSVSMVSNAMPLTIVR